MIQYYDLTTLIKENVSKWGGWTSIPISKSLCFLISIDAGTNDEIEEATLGVRIAFQLKMIPRLKKEQYPEFVASKELREEILNFIKFRYNKVFASSLYRIEGFSKRSPDIGHTFPKGKDYGSVSIFKFDRNIVTLIYDQVSMRKPVSFDELIKELKRNVKSRLTGDVLFKPSSQNPWRI